jgi:hypothetical protein
MPARPLVRALLLATLPACGDPLAAGDFLGTPSIHLVGTIKGNPGYATVPHRPRMGVLWVPLGGPGLEGTGTLASAVTTSFPSQFQLDLFDAPERSPGEIRAADGPLEALMGFGRLVVVDDVDEDGRFSYSGGALTPPDQFIGAAPKHVVLYTDRIGAPGPALRRFMANPERLSIGYQIGRGLCGQDGEPDRLEVIAPTAPVTLELVPPTQSFPMSAECLSLVP